MPVISPAFLFIDSRLRSCSDRARLLWPYLYCAANGYARLEVNMTNILYLCFDDFGSDKPTKQELHDVMKEYVERWLVIPYKVDGVMWLQFDVEPRFLGKYRTVEDRRSPAAPQACIEIFQKGKTRWLKEHEASQHEEVNNVEV
jgi:hypothetical protein